VKVKEIKAVLGPLGLLFGVNCFPGEPMPMCHCVSIRSGTAKQAIDAIKAAGGDAWHLYGFGQGSESIGVRRK
jgi:hypothetical protein